MRIDIVTFPGVDDLDLTGPLRVLRGAGFTVRLVGRTGRGPVTTSSGLRFETDAAFDPRPDVLVVPGGGWGARAEAGAWGEVRRGDWLPLLKRATPELLVGVCTGTMLLAHAGLLTGRRANTHHSAAAELAELGVEVVPDRVVDDGDLITGGGVTSGIDVALWLVERIAGRELADGLATGLEYPRYRPSPDS